MTKTRNPDPAMLAAGMYRRRSGIIHIDTMVAGRRIRRSTRTRDPHDAKRQLDLIRGGLQLAEITGECPEILRPRQNLEEFTAVALEELRRDGRAARTLTRYEGVWRRFTAFARGRIGRAPRVDDIDHDLVVAYRHHAATTPRVRGRSPHGRIPSPRTVANELDILRALLLRAVAQGLLRRNPEHGVGRPRDCYQPRERWLNDAEIDRLVSAAYRWREWHRGKSGIDGTALGLAIECYLMTGMRTQELRWMTLADALDRDPSGRPVCRIRKREVACHGLVVSDRREYDAYRRADGVGWAPELRSGGTVGEAEFHPDHGCFVQPLLLSWLPKTRDRQLPLSAGTRELLDRVLAWRTDHLADDHPLNRARRALGLPEPPWLFPDRSGLPWRWDVPRIMVNTQPALGHPSGP